MRSRPYADTHGNPTIGIGRNLRGNGITVDELSAIAKEVDRNLLFREAHIQNGRVHIHSLALANRVFVKPLTREDVRYLLINDLVEVANEAVTIFGEQVWYGISEARRLAILDVLFNLGQPAFEKFVKFIRAVKTKDWVTASVELLLSDAARENIVRFHRASVVIRTDDVRLFDLQ